MSNDRLAVSWKTLGGVAAVLVLGMVAVAPAFVCTGNRGNITSSPARAEAGTTIDLTGSSFQGGLESLPVNIRWGGASGLLLAQVATDEGGTFTSKVTVPSGAQPGWHQISATQQQRGTEQFYTANFAFEVDGVTPAPAPAVTQPAAPTPSPAPSPASQPTAAATPQAAPTAPAPATAQAATARTPVVAKASPAPAPVAPAPVSATPAPEQPPAAAPPAPVDPASPSTESAIPARAEPIPALVQSDPVAMGGPRTVTIDSGAPLWMLVPLVALGLTLFAASCAAVVSDVRQRRVKAKVSA